MAVYNTVEIWNDKKRAVASAKKLRGTVIKKHGEKYKIRSRVVKVIRRGDIIKSGVISRIGYKVEVSWNKIK